jgi:hypothetical protein
LRELRGGIEYVNVLAVTPPMLIDIGVLPR